MSVGPSTVDIVAPQATSLRRWLTLPWWGSATILGLLYWAVFGLLFTIVGLPLHYLLPRRTGERLGRTLLHYAFRGFNRFLAATRLVQADLTGLDRLLTSSSPLIIAPNHTALWDAVFVIARLPQPVCIMKKEVLTNPFLGGGAKLAGYIPNGDSTRMIRDAADALAEGGQLLLFPEGTRTRHDARWTNPFKGGFALIAARAKVPVVPVFIRTNSRFLEKGWPLWRIPEFPIHLSFELGEPVGYLPGETPKQFTLRVQALFESELSKPHPLRRRIADDRVA
jgi:1-acyl-sn-glycerol-3-phosphate acyltransferase